MELQTLQSVFGAPYHSFEPGLMPNSSKLSTILILGALVVVGVIIFKVYQEQIPPLPLQDQEN